MSFQSLTASRASVAPTTQAVAPASSAAATTSVRPTTSAAAATTSVAAVAPTSAAAATSAAATSAAAPAVSTSTAAAAPATSSSSVLAASSSVAPSSSSAAASSSSSSSSASIAPSSTSTVASSSSSSRSSSASSALPSNFGTTSQTASTSSSTLPGSTIGAIAGGVAGGLILIALAFTCWRRMKSRKNRVPPPPPREMTFNTSASTARARASSGAMLERGLGMGVGGMHRENSYATLIHPQSQMSRHPSYYNTYPIATPSTSNGSPPDTSPEVHPVEDAAVLGAMVGASGANTASGSGHSTPGSLPTTAEEPIARNTRRVSSVDRLRMEALAATGRVSPSQPPNFPVPYPAQHPIPDGSVAEGSVTPPSPMYMQSSAGSTSSPMLGGGPYPRPGSMSSLSSRGYNYLHVGPARGAPHQGRPIQLEMPRMLSGQDGPGSPTSPRPASGDWSGKRLSGGFDQFPNPYPPSPRSPTQPTGHRRASSSNSLSGLSNSGRAPSGSYQPSLGPMPGRPAHQG